MAAPVAASRRGGGVVAAGREANKGAADCDEQSEDLDENHSEERRSICTGEHTGLSVRLTGTTPRGDGGHYARALMASTRRPAAARLAFFLFAGGLGALGCAACEVFGPGRLPRPRHRAQPSASFPSSRPRWQGRGGRGRSPAERPGPSRPDAT